MSIVFLLSVILKGLGAVLEVLLQVMIPGGWACGIRNLLYLGQCGGSCVLGIVFRYYEMQYFLLIK